MSDNIPGWISIHRKIKNHWLYTEHREFSKFEAWLDMLMSVNFKSERVLIAGQLIECNRGQSVYSIKTWADRWHWHESKVRRLFELLKKDGMIFTENVQKTTRLTICNYESYQDDRRANDEQPTSARRAADEQTTTSNKDNKEINIPIGGVAANAAERDILSLEEEKQKPEQRGPATIPKSPKSPKEKLVPPTEAEVKEEFVTRTGVNGAISEQFARVFCNHYALKNWTYGKGRTPLKEWKRAMTSSWDLKKFVSDNQHLLARVPVKPKSTKPLTDADYF